MICIMDYGVGNIQAFLNLFKRLGMDVQRADTPELLASATRIILPGVGHFDYAMKGLNDSGMLPKLHELVLESHVPVIGICVGMQILAQGSDEGSLPGLNWVPGRVRALSSFPQTSALAMPHMGCNALKPRAHSLLFSKGFDDRMRFYFLHSYFFDAEYKEDVSATASYGVEFAAAISRGHIHGVQFHPEKSHHWGEQLLKNFVEAY